MELERLLAVVVMLVLGSGTMILGWLGRRRRLDDVLGDWTKQTATAESWNAAHVTIGTRFMVAGGLAGITGLIALAVPPDAIGPVVVAGPSRCSCPS